GPAVAGGGRRHAAGARPVAPPQARVEPGHHEDPPVPHTVDQRPRGRPARRERLDAFRAKPQGRPEEPYEPSDKRRRERQQRIHSLLRPRGAITRLPPAPGRGAPRESPRPARPAAPPA